MVSDDKSTREAYEVAKKELQSLLGKKRAIDKNLVNLENSIYLFEGAYLEDTIGTGNIVKGFDGYCRVSSSISGGIGGTGLGHHSHGSISRRAGGGRGGVDDNDRIFSKSSRTYTKSLQLKEKEIAIANGTYVPSEDESLGGTNNGPGTGTSTPAGAPSDSKKKKAASASTSHKKRPRSRPDSDATSDEDVASSVSKKKGRIVKADD